MTWRHTLVAIAVVGAAATTWSLTVDDTFSAVVAGAVTAVALALRSEPPEPPWP